MSQTPRYLKSSMVTILILVTSGSVIACGPAPPPTPVPRPTVAEAEVALVPPPTPTTPASPTPPPAVLAPDDGCEDCHSDQERLIATAEEAVVVEVLSEGEG